MSYFRKRDRYYTDEVVKMVKPKYITQYWGREPTDKELKIRFKILDDSDFGYEKSEYKDLEKYFKSSGVY